jgi:hypothetical protein
MVEIEPEVAGSSPDEDIEFLPIYLTLLADNVSGVYSACSRYEHQKIFLGIKRGRRIRLTT